MEELRKNNIYEAEVTGLTSEGAGVCRICGRAVFVPRAIPGERWRIRIVKVTKTAVYGRGEELLSASPERVEPACPNFGRCGGCSFLHMSYKAELRYKLERVNDAFKRIGGLELCAERIIGSETVEGYRNKSIVAVGEAENGPVAGFYRSGSHDIVPVERCMLQSDEASACARSVTGWMKRRGVRAGSGGVRHVYTRRARDGAALCCVVTGRRFSPALARTLVESLRRGCPGLVGVVECLNRSESNTVLSGEFRTLWGSSTLTDVLCGSEFELSPQAFYQINPPQAERLYELAVDYALPEPGGTVLDLYCGAGTISLALARRAGQVIGAEIVPEAVENARRNAARNGIGNAEFICADAGDAARLLSERGIRPDAIVVDPPRKGMSEEALRQVAKMQPKRIAYVSCDPATLARDLKRLTELGYVPQKAVAVDMFPKTAHVETVVLLTERPLVLVEPCGKYLESYLEAREEGRENGMASDDFSSAPAGELLKRYDDFRCGRDLPPGWVAADYYWLVDEDKNRFIGEIGIRHGLTEALRRYGGHIGYAVRPSEWNKGHGTLMLGLALEKARDLGITTAMITCDDDNAASARVMEKNGFTLLDRVTNTVDGRTVITRRYTKNLSPGPAGKGAV